MFILGREKAKDEFDRLIAEGKSFVEARAIMREKERAKRDNVTQARVDKTLALFDTSSAGESKLAKSASTYGPPLAISSIKTLSAISLQRLPEARQPLSLSNRVLKDVELVDVAIRRSYVNGILDLRGCQLTAIPGRAMNTLSVQFGNITSINLNGNLLTTIPPAMAPLCPRLTELSVSNNKLRDVPRSILYIPKVRELNLSYNLIEEVDVLQAPDMEVLRLSNNRVSSLDNMSYLRKLHTLHLDFCLMSQLTGHMRKLKNLTYLDLSHNTLVSLALPSREAAVSKAALAGEKTDAIVASSAAKVGDNRVWEEVLDPFTGRKSYFCKSTKEVRRTKPPGFDEQDARRREALKKQRTELVAKAAELGLGPYEAPPMERPPTAPVHNAASSTDMILRPSTAQLWQEFIDEGTRSAGVAM